LQFDANGLTARNHFQLVVRALSGIGGRSHETAANKGGKQEMVF
jgi:hypothetical protein